jgi:branched-chain amino acid transport system ATP-binding protein
MTAVLECRGLTAGYHGVPVVRNLDLRVDPGEIVALLGPNGAGKTTTLLALSGMLPALAGEVQTLGAAVSTSRPHLNARRGVAHVPDDRALFGSLTVRENLRLGIGPRSNDDAIDGVLEFFPPLREITGRRAGVLSGGQQQMLALARAVIGNPKALIIDEMTQGLAPVVAQSLLPMIRRLKDVSDVGVLLVEQHVDLALAIADRAVVLNHGEIVLSGAAADLRERRELLRASYMGEEVYEALPAEAIQPTATTSGGLP